MPNQSYLVPLAAGFSRGRHGAKRPAGCGLRQLLLTNVDRGTTGGTKPGERVRAAVRAGGAERTPRILPLEGVQGGLRRPREEEPGSSVGRGGPQLHGDEGRGGGVGLDGCVRSMDG